MREWWGKEGGIGGGGEARNKGELRSRRVDARTGKGFELTRLQTSRSPNRRITNDHSIHSTLLHSPRNIPDLFLSQIRRNLHHDLWSPPIASNHQRIPLLHHPPQQRPQPPSTLQRSQSRRVRTADVDDQHIRVGSKEPDSRQVVLVRILRGELVLAQVDGEKRVRGQGSVEVLRWEGVGRVVVGWEESFVVFVE